MHGFSAVGFDNVRLVFSELTTGWLLGENDGASDDEPFNLLHGAGSKAGVTVATTFSNISFFFFVVVDSGFSCPVYSSACINISCSRTLLNTILPNSPNFLCSKT